MFSRHLPLLFFMRTLEFVIAHQNNGWRIASVMHRLGFSTALIRSLKQTENSILLNGVPVRTISKVKTGDILTVILTEKGIPPKPSDTKVDILFEDEDLLVVNKPPTIAVHETRHHQGNALSNAVAAVSDITVFRPIYRLDKGTGGLIVAAKNQFAAAKLAGNVDKDYYAVIKGVLTGQGTIDAPIGRTEDSIVKRCVRADGEHAVTHWQAIKTNGENTLLKIHLETGRTHQIRVHFSHLGTPLIGDTMYGSADTRIDHQALLCKSVRFVHPVTNRYLEFDCPFPDDFKGLI